MVTSTNVQIQNVNFNDFLNAVEDLLARKLSTIQLPEPNADSELITRTQVAEIFGVTLPTVYAWTKAGILTAYRIGNKIRFKKSEVLAACKPIKKGGVRA